MKKPSLLVALLLITCVAAAPIPYIQEIQAGSWTGTATPPDGQIIDVVYEVKTEEGLAITLRISEAQMVLPASEPKLEGSILTFGLSVEQDELTCTLERQNDGSFQGECIDLDGGAGYLVMNPPQTR